MKLFTSDLQLHFHKLFLLKLFTQKSELTRNMRAGLGVYVSTVTKDRQLGICPCLAPTKHKRLEVIIWQLRLPAADIPTRIVITAPAQ